MRIYIVQRYFNLYDKFEDVAAFDTREQAQALYDIIREKESKEALPIHQRVRVTSLKLNHVLVGYLRGLDLDGFNKE